MIRNPRPNILINTELDLMPALFQFAGVPIPASLAGESFLIENPHDSIVVENHTWQGAEIGGFHLQIHGRMLRTARFKYCCYAYGEHRESSVNLETTRAKCATSPAPRPPSITTAARCVANATSLEVAVQCAVFSTWQA